MKRPEGFDPPKREPGGRGAPEGAGTTPAPRRPRQPAQKPARAQTAGPAQKSAPTQQPNPTHQPSPARKPRRTEKLAPATRPGADAPRQPNPRVTSEAKAELKRAAKERRHYERSEVRRFTRRSRNRRRAWLASLAIAVALVALVAIAVYSPILALRTIRIEGASRVSSADIRAAVDDQLGTPLALIDFDRITTKLAKFSLIRSYVTETVPPNTLVVHIVERAPIAAIATADGFTVVDPAGVVISTTDVRPPAIPLIDIGSATTKDAAFASVVQVLLALPPAVLAQVDQVTAQTRDDVTLILAGAGQRVVWGTADRSDVKARVLADLMKTQSATAAVEYDVSAPSSAVVRPG